MIKILKNIRSIINVMSEICGKICNVVILLINIFVFYEVISRYIFNSPTIWVTETCQYLLPVLCFVGASYCLKHKGHISVDLLVRYFSKRTRKIINVIAYSASLLFFIVLGLEGYFSWREAYVLHFTSGTIFDIPLWIPYIALPIGMIFLGLQFIVEISDCIVEPLNHERGSDYGCD